MKAYIYCEVKTRGIHSFFLVTDSEKYFLFNQNYRRGVQEYFGRGVRLEQAMDFSKTHGNNAVIRTMEKLPSYIRYIEKEYEIAVLKQTEKKHRQYRTNTQSLAACWA